MFYYKIINSPARNINLQVRHGHSASAYVLDGLEYELRTRAIIRHNSSPRPERAAIQLTHPNIMSTGNFMHYLGRKTIYK